MGKQSSLSCRRTNRLTQQFIRVDRIDCSYDVQGADPRLQIPVDSFSVGAVVPPTPGNVATTTAFSEGVFGFEVVSPDLFAFLNVNRNLLPELPFRATATCSAVGVTQAGDTLETNRLNYFLQFGDVAECCTGEPGFQNGPGTGGTLQTFGGTGGAAAAQETSQAAAAEEG